MRGRVPIHVGNGHKLGDRGGEPAHTLSIDELPEHTHSFTGTKLDGTTNNPSGAVPARSFTDRYGPPSSLVSMDSASISNTGGSQAHDNMQPFLTLTFAIALQGIFPTPT